TFYTGAPGNREFRVTGGSTSDGPTANLYGIAVACHSERDEWRVNSMGQIVDDNSTRNPADWSPKWGDLSATPPAPFGPDDYSFWTGALRQSRTPDGYDGDLKGCFHSLRTAYDMAGSAYYDYSWKYLKEAEIRDEMRLPISAVMVNWQRL
ncbi:MAG: hypothetical protein AB1758_15505, partial [Candidatus Eremiobacterota bacterium]